MPDFISSIIAIGVFAFAAWQYLSVRRLELEDAQFKQFHTVVRQLVTEDKKESGNPFIDVQIASAYQLTMMSQRYNKTSRIILNRLLARTKGREGFTDLEDSVKECIAILESQRSKSINPEGRRLIFFEVAFTTGTVIVAAQALKEIFSIEPMWMLIGSALAAFLLLLFFRIYRIKPSRAS